MGDVDRIFLGYFSSRNLSSSIFVVVVVVVANHLITLLPLSYSFHSSGVGSYIRSSFLTTRRVVAVHSALGFENKQNKTKQTTNSSVVV